MTHESNSSSRPPKTSKEAAVAAWNDCLEDLPNDEEWATILRSLNIHDRHDRMEIEEIIEFEASDEFYLPLHDAFDDLKSEFEDLWD